jgi:hypothetical protein
MSSELALCLPSIGVLDESSDIEVQTRSVLALLIENWDAAWSTDSIQPDSSRCPNCDVLTHSQRSPYCSDSCREMSAFVRQFRHAVQDELIKSPEHQAALGQKLWFVLGGGYPRRDVLVPDKVRTKVIEREGNKCQQCGAKATTIDHSGSG